MIKKIVIFTCLLVSFFVLCGCKQDAFLDDYPQLTDKKHVFTVCDVDTVLNMFRNKETGVIVLGFKACPWCQAIVPYVNEVAKENKIKEVYYLDIKEMRDNENSDEHIKYLELKNYLREAVDTTKDRLNAPTTYVLLKGQLVDYHLDTVATHVMNEDEILPPMTEEEAREMKEILTQMFVKIK